MENSLEPAQKEPPQPSSPNIEIIKNPKLYFITKLLLFLIIIIERLVMLLKGETSDILAYFLLQVLIIPTSLLMEYILFRFMSRRKVAKNLQFVVILLIYIIYFEILVECSLQMFNSDTDQYHNILRSDLLFLATLSLLIDSPSFQLIILLYLIVIFFFRLSTIPASAYVITWAVMLAVVVISAMVYLLTSLSETKKQLPDKLQKEFQSFTQGLAVVTTDGEILYMNGNFRGFLESDSDYEAFDKVLSLKNFDSYPEKIRRGVIEEFKKEKASSPPLKRKPSFRPREFTRQLSRGNTMKKSIAESEMMAMRESVDITRVVQRQDSNVDRSSYINLYADENPVTGISKARTQYSQSHRLLPKKNQNKTDTEHGLMLNEDTVHSLIESILTKANEDPQLKVNWEWAESGKRWLTAILEKKPANTADDKSPSRDSLVSKIKVLSPILKDRKLLEIRILPFQNTKNEGIIMSIGDALMEAKLQDAQEINEQKDRILRFVSHEFRTPLNCSLSVLDMLKNKISINLCTCSLEPALNSSKLLLSLVNDLLDFAQIKARKLKISVQPCNLKKVIEEVIDMMKLQASIQDISLTLSWDNDISKRFYTDPNRVKQILLNLISNAFKFTPQGGSVTIKTSAFDSAIVRVEVIDTGRGISPKNLEKLFEEFAKVQESSHLNPQGVGLGLVISRLLSQQLGPEDFGLVAESELGKGTTFSFLLISKLEEALKSGIASNTNLEVSDDEDRSKPEKLLQKLKNDYGAIDQATKPPIKEESVKIKISDFELGDQLPFKSKLFDSKMNLQKDAARSSRFTTSVKSGTIQTRNYIEIDPIKLSALSQGSYVLKKIPNKQFNKVMSRPRSLGRSKTVIGEGAENETDWGFVALVNNLNNRCPCQKVLIVDDDAFNLTAASLLLKSMDLTSTSVVDGELAIQAVLKNQGHHPSCENFCIILMDIEMPRLNGFETTRLLRKKMLEGEISFIPIIGITGHNPKEKKAECLISGMNDIIRKPITPHLLQELVMKWVDDVDS